VASSAAKLRFKTASGAAIGNDTKSRLALKAGDKNISLKRSFAAEDAAGADNANNGISEDTAMSRTISLF
jgi:hypothetical protein